MSNFLEITKNEGQNQRDKIITQLKAIERQAEETQEPNKFNFMVSVAEGISDTRRALRAYHWLKGCYALKRSDLGVMMHYSDPTHATWALNYIGDGVIQHFKTKNVFTVYKGNIIEGTTPPDRKSGKVELLARSSDGVQRI